MISEHIRGNAVGYVAVFLALCGTSIAAPHHKKKVTSETIRDLTIREQDLADKAVTNRKIADGAVDGRAVLDGSLTGADIAKGTIVGGNLANGTITGNKIADKTITGNLIDYTTIDGTQIPGILSGKAEVYTNALRVDPAALGHTGDASGVLLSIPRLGELRYTCTDAASPGPFRSRFTFRNTLPVPNNPFSHPGQSLTVIREDKDGNLFTTDPLGPGNGDPGPFTSETPSYTAQADDVEHFHVTAIPTAAPQPPTFPPDPNAPPLWETPTRGAEITVSAHKLADSSIGDPNRDLSPVPGCMMVATAQVTKNP